jgi:lysophospholipase L1-like esterase
MKQILQDTDFAPLFSDGTHLRPPGHERIADAVVKKLLREGIVVTGKGG